MQLIIQSGVQEPVVVNVHADATVQDLKAAVEDKEFVPAYLQRLVYGSETLRNGKLAEFGITTESIICLEMGIDAGMRAKWRKKRMRRLRRKRRKMRSRAK
jgi:hypothetical protein